MITSQIKELRIKNLSIHGILCLSLVILYTPLVMWLPKDDIIHMIGGLLLLMIVISLFIGIYRIKHSLVNKIIRIKEIKKMIPYPEKFTDSMVEMGGFLKSYRYKQHIIPEFLIEFREGRTLYLYQMIQQPTDECYRILKVNNFDIALVIDEKKKKRIVHLGNAELVN